MENGRFFWWFWLAVVLDIAILTGFSWSTLRILTSAFPYWSLRPSSWTSEFIIGLIFSLAGFVAIAWAIRGTRMPLLFWNFCFLAIHVVVVYQNQLQRIPSNFAIIPTVGVVIVILTL